MQDNEIYIWLNEVGVKVPFIWLDACIQHISQNTNEIENAMELRDLVFGQWLATDLHDLHYNAIPNELLQAKSHIFYGCLALQVVSCVDISKPLFDQVRQLDGIEQSENVLVNEDAVDGESQMPPPQSGSNFQPTKWNTTKSSNNVTLLCTLTDGINVIKLMEWSSASPPCSVLRENRQKLISGCKIQITGPFLCRRGTILLGFPVAAGGNNRNLGAVGVGGDVGNNNGKIHILGGQVEELIENFNVKEILVDYLMTNLSKCNEISTEPLRRLIENSENKKPIPNLPIDFVQNENQQQQQQPPPLPPPPNVVSRRSFSPSPLNSLTNFDNLPTFEDEPPATTVKDEPKTSPPFQSSTVFVSPAAAAAPVANVRLIGRMLPKESVNINCPPFCYLQDVMNHLKLNQSQNDFVIKGFVLTLTTKLSCSQEKWNLMLSLSDGTASVNCLVHSDLISTWLGVQPSEYLAVSSKTSTTTTATEIDLPTRKSLALRREIETRFRSTESFLTSLNGIFTLKINRENKNVVLMKFDEINQDNLNKLLNRCMIYVQMS